MQQHGEHISRLYCYQPGNWHMATRHVSHNTTYLLMSTEMEKECTAHVHLSNTATTVMFCLCLCMICLLGTRQRNCKDFTDYVSCFHHQSLWSEVSGEALRFDMLSGRWLRLSDPIRPGNMTKLSMVAVSLK